MGQVAQPTFNTVASGGSDTPLLVAAAVTFTIATNTQKVLANQVVTQATGIVLTVGTGVLTYVN